MKRTLSFVLVLCLLLTLVPFAAFADFSDTGSLIPAFKESIDWAVAQGITNGYEDNTFRPGSSCTRAQAVTFLWRAAGQPAPQSAGNPFTDVSSSGSLKPYYSAILWAVEQGITNGYEDKTFRPNATVTRAQFVTFLWRMEGKPSPAAGVGGFADAAKIAAPYVDAVAWAVEQGITNGYEDNTFRPNGVCTRAHVVTFLFRDIQNAECTVSFDSRGGSPAAPQKVKKGECAQKPADPTREGYIFCGWCRSDDPEEEFDFSAPVSGSLTLCALWLLDGESYERVTGALHESSVLAQAPFADEEGYVAEENKTDAVDAVYDAWSALSDPHVVEVLNGVFSVTAVLSDGSSVFYAPSIPNTFSDEYGVASYSTTIDDIFILDPFGTKVASQKAADTVRDGAEEYVIHHDNGREGLTVERLISSLDSYRENDPRVIFWHGHGDCVSYLDGRREVSTPTFVLNDAINEQFRSRHRLDIAQNRIIIADSGSFCVVTDKFFQKYLPRVNGGLFVAGTCYGYATDRMMNVFIGKGFDAYIGFDNSVQQDVSNDFMEKLAKQLLKKDGEDFYVPLGEAVDKSDGLLGRLSFCADIGKSLSDSNVHATYLCVYDKDPEYPFRLVPMKHRIEFTLLDDFTGEPVADADITIPKPHGRGNVKEMSDAEGFAVAEIDFSGSVTVRIKAENYTDKTFTFDTKDYDNKRVIKLDPVKLTGLFDLSATVADEETGEAVSGAEARVRRFDSDTVIAAAKASSTGLFRFKELPAGNYTVTVSCEGYEDLRFTITGQAGDDLTYPTLKMKKDDPIGKQIELIMANKKLWCSTGKMTGEIYRCAVTDMDQDGLLEIFEHHMLGTGIVSLYNIYEVSPDMRSLVKIGTSSRGMPDIGEKHDCYYDRVTDTYSFLITDTLRNGWGSTSYGDYLVSLTDTEMKTELVRLRLSEYDSSGTYTDTYYNASNVSVSKSAFDRLVDSRCAGLTKLSASFGWIDYNKNSTTLSWFSDTSSLVGNTAAKQAFLDSYKAFQLTPAAS